MNTPNALSLLIPIVVLGLLANAGGEAQGSRPEPNPDGEPERDLSHEQTLQWVARHRAWRRARKTRPIWVRPITPDEVGKMFQTADHATETARAGFLLCVGVAGEPWFQQPEKIEAKYRADGDEVPKQFKFDTRPRAYRLYKPNGKVFNWVARVEGPAIKGFFIKPSYDPAHPLYAPSGGYVVKDDCPDPYQDRPGDVWLVQESLFKSTYELTDDGR